MAAGWQAGGKGAIACYKCGRVGHLARDCKEQAQTQARQQQQQQQQVSEEGEGQRQSNETAPQTSKKRKKPKLTAERHLLGSENGLQLVFNTFPATFKKRARGRGHEANDLGRFISMYEDWQRKLFPHCGFNYFLDKVEAEAGKRVVTEMTDQMRDKYVHGIDIDANAREEQQRQDKAAEAAEAERHREHVDGGARNVLGDFEDEEDQLAWMQFNVVGGEQAGVTGRAQGKHPSAWRRVEGESSEDEA